MVSNDGERRRWSDPAMVASWPSRETLTDSVMPRLLKLASAQPGERVLDIGSGGGKATLVVGESVLQTGEVVGADISQGMSPDPVGPQ